MSKNMAHAKRGLVKARRRTIALKIMVVLLFAAAGFSYFTGSAFSQHEQNPSNKTGLDGQIKSNAQQMFEEGRRIFRYDTFGDEVYWTDKLKLHRAIQGSKFGGVGPGVSPKTALAVGLKVDMDALPADLVEKVKK